MSVLTLVPCGAAALPTVDPWFDEDETRRRLGGRDWPAMVLRLASDLPASADAEKVAERSAWLAVQDETPVGLVYVELDRDGSASFAFVIDPARRRNGLGRSTVRAVLAYLDPRAVREVTCGVEADNLAGLRCLEGLGFVRRSDEPDADGFLYLAHQR